MGRPKPEKVFGTQPSGEIFTIEGYVKPDKPNRVNVFKTEPTGIVHTIEGYVKPDKPSRDVVFKRDPADYGTFAQQVELSNLQVILEPEFKIWGTNPNHIIVTADVIINTSDTNPQKLQYQVLNSNDEQIQFSVFPKEMTPNKKTKLKIGIDQPSKNAHFPDGYFLLRAWSVSTWTGERFDWGSHTGIKVWKRSSNVASIDDVVMDHKEVIASTPKSEPEPSRPYKEVDQELPDPYADYTEPVPFITLEPDPTPEPDSTPEPITTPEPLNLLPYAIVLGAVIGVGSVVFKKKGDN